ncbi:hypothetical protein [Amycolatopsis solani]|uniref:hypothetical protein n=1 Tax=Amycolatopsis solani TaxID=3028615 RepID=UPI0025B1EF25|nr:hypothetical protein [Amycolatopsis sp. MEP2-6]
MKRAGAAALLAAALITVLTPLASAADGPSAGSSPVGGTGGGPYIGDVPAPGGGAR